MFARNTHLESCVNKSTKNFISLCEYVLIVSDLLHLRLDTSRYIRLTSDNTMDKLRSIVIHLQWQIDR